MDADSKNMLAIRRVSEDERELVRLFLQELANHQRKVSDAYAARYTEHTVDDWTEACCDELASGHGWAAVAELDNRPVGFIKLGLDDGIGSIDDLVVLPEARGQGVGSQLMGWARREFAQHGIREVELTVSEGNDDAFVFYERHGFRTATRTMRSSISPGT
ncbi:GNAT family N-acetyltransferase [Collinsella tanakaei]|nr:GNAT family N-acetyltransferase [Collinsella tanakaei]